MGGQGFPQGAGRQDRAIAEGPAARSQEYPAVGGQGQVLKAVIQYQDIGPQFGYGGPGRPAAILVHHHPEGGQIRGHQPRLVAALGRPGQRARPPGDHQGGGAERPAAVAPAEYGRPMAFGQEKTGQGQGQGSFAGPSDREVAEAYDRPGGPLALSEGGVKFAPQPGPPAIYLAQGL